MADSKGKAKNGRKKSNVLRYFFLNGKLHKSLHKNRATDVIITWSYPDEKRVGYTYSDVRKNMEKAFTTQEVSQLVNRSRHRIEMLIIEGHIEQPQYTYGLLTKNKFQYMWNEASIMDLHGYLSTVHTGRPRKDGLVTAVRLPSARELRAMIRNQPVMGYLDKDGNFIPTWLAEDI